ncbi:oxepin-CoA hydrolase, alternative type [Paracoccus onubensis]|uniref:Enoyl-CoA hydratase n=1 Tax=Paracoccus onubensis TaxID=1675788 RepID=A0A418T0C9_9RHOB|nr:enoyl-CoA hydratase family protein [Paracoccus onubensis]RJE86648.1 enoyl-CoA hydratase [Paracoccus onubensis]
MTTSAAPVTEIRAERDNDVLILSLDGPRTRNSISRPVYEAIRAQMLDAGENSDIRAIVMTGLHGFFSSGGNIANLQKSAQGSMADATQGTDALNTMILAIRNCRKPVIAAVEGGAAGAGLSLALSCDMIVAAENAKFTAAYVKIGLSPDGGLTHFLCDGLPRQLVTEMCLTGEPVDAARLHSCGIVNRIVPADGALAAAKDLAAKLANGPTNAMAVIKTEIGAASCNELATQLDLEARGINTARFGKEAAEGLAAFLEKRKPDFRR